MARIRSVKPELLAQTRRGELDLGPDGVALYRAWGQDGLLLYVGISRDLYERWRKHRRLAPWWSLATELTFEVYPRRYAAEVAERTAIRTERPAFNIALAVT